jgi:ABC-type uncharacterized transport system substrate-binding protein
LCCRSVALRAIFRYGEGMSAALRCLIIISMLTIGPAARAHPHVWVTVRCELLYAPDGSTTGIRYHWVFDDMFSAFAVQGLEGKEKGKLTREQLAPVAKDNLEPLKDDDYFTYVTADGTKVLLADPLPDYWLDYKDELLTLNFTLPFKQAVKAKDLKIEIYDPTYFIALELQKQVPVRLVGAPEQCKLAVELPRELTYAEGKKLSQDPEAASNWGSFFANKIMVTCP